MVSESCLRAQSVIPVWGLDSFRISVIARLTPFWVAVTKDNRHDRTYLFGDKERAHIVSLVWKVIGSASQPVSTWILNKKAFLFKEKNIQIFARQRSHTFSNIRNFFY